MISGYESIDKLINKKTGNKKADYFLYDRKVVVEQKEFLNSPQHDKKGNAYQDYVSMLFQKHNINPYTQDKSYLREKHKLLSPDEAVHHAKLRNAFYDKIKDDIHIANNQIESTKKVFGTPNAVGVVLMIFDRVNGIMPAVISERVGRTFDIKKDGTPLYKHVDIFIYAIHLKDLEYNNATCMNGHITRDSSGEHPKVARSILDVLRIDVVNPRLRTVFKESDYVRQLVPNLFSNKTRS